MKNKVMEEKNSNKDLSDKVTTLNSIQMEKEDHIFQSEQRYDDFRKILLGLSDDKVTPKYLLYAFLGILPALSAKWIYTLIPVHNVIENSYYWYELPLQLMFGYLMIWAIWNLCLLIFYEHQVHTNTSPHCDIMVYNGICNNYIFCMLVFYLERPSAPKISSAIHGVYLPGNVNIGYYSCTLLTVSLGMAQK